VSRQKSLVCTPKNTEMGGIYQFTMQFTVKTYQPQKKLELENRLPYSVGNIMLPYLGTIASHGTHEMKILFS